MIFHEFGDCTLPHIMLIHGGGNAWWNYLRQACVLARHYHVILPTLDGHGEECQTPYVSTERTADQLMDYIQQHCGGHLFALCGSFPGRPDRDGAFDTEVGSYRKGHH
ncbi:MAG: alpha/beta fold hydrolase [Flavonifractor plautii]